MPLDPYEEWKRYYEVRLLEAQLEKIADEREKIRVDIVDANKRWDKFMKDIAMDEKRLALEQKRFTQQWWTVLIAALAAMATYLTWWTHAHP